MNKRFFLGMFAAASMLFTTSCSQDEKLSPETGNEATISFSLQMEGGLQTKAGETGETPTTSKIGDGTKISQLIYEVYDASGTKLNVLKGDNGNYTGQKIENLTPDQKANILDKNKGHEVKITLAKGQTYSVVFWAQYANEDNTNNYYTTSNGLNNIGINYNDINNNENRDAFYAVSTFSVSGHQSIDVELTRPFSQLNVGVIADDWNAAVASGIEIEKSSVKIPKVANNFNALTQITTGEVDVEYSANVIPAEKLVIKTDADGNEQESQYYYLSMSYLLAPAEMATLSGLEFTFTSKDNSKQPIVFKENLNNIPFQRNWRTNIIGQILTGNITFNVVIDPEFTNDYNVNTDGPTIVYDYDNFKSAIAGGATSVVWNAAELPEECNDGIVKLPKLNEGVTSEPVSVSFPNLTDEVKFEFDDKDATNNPDVVEISAPNATKVEADLPGAEVIINGNTVSAPATKSTTQSDSNTYASVTITNAASVVISEGVTVTSLTVNNGDLSVFGKVGTLAFGEGYAGSFVECNVADVADWSIATNANNSAKNIILANNVSFDSATDKVINLPAATSLLNLNNYTLTANQLNIVNNQTVEIKNGNIILNTSQIKAGALNMATANSKVTIDGVTLTVPNNDYAIMVGSKDNRTTTVENTLTVTNSTINANYTDAIGIQLEGNQTLTVENTTINHKYFGINQNGILTGSNVTVKNATISGQYSGIFMSNDGTNKNTLTVTGSHITSKDESAIEVIKTDISVSGSTLASEATVQKFVESQDGSKYYGYGIVLRAHGNGMIYDGIVSISDNIYNVVTGGVGVYADAYMSDDDKTYFIGSKKGLVWIAGVVNGEIKNNTNGESGVFEDRTIMLVSDIDLNNEEWTPIGNVVKTPSTAFAGTFDGQNHVISNLKITDNTSNHAAAGLFGSVTGIIKNIKIKNVDISSTHYAGAIVAYSTSDKMVIENCHVDGGKIVSTPEMLDNGYDNGDKVGGIIGYANTGIIKGCSVKNLQISAYRDLGGIAGYYDGSNLSNCSVSNITIIQDNTNGYKDNIISYGAIIGCSNYYTKQPGSGVNCSQEQVTLSVK